MVAAQSGELFAQLDVEIRVVDVNDNHIELLDRISRFNVVEDEQRGRTFEFTFPYSLS